MQTVRPVLRPAGLCQGKPCCGNCPHLSKYPRECSLMRCVVRSKTLQNTFCTIQDKDTLVRVPKCPALPSTGCGGRRLISSRKEVPVQHCDEDQGTNDPWGSLSEPCHAIDIGGTPLELLTLIPQLAGDFACGCEQQGIVQRTAGTARRRHALSSASPLSRTSFKFRCMML